MSCIVVVDERMELVGLEPLFFNYFFNDIPIDEAKVIDITFLCFVLGSPTRNHSIPTPLFLECFSGGDDLSAISQVTCPQFSFLRKTAGAAQFSTAT